MFRTGRVRGSVHFVAGGREKHPELFQSTDGGPLDGRRRHFAVATENVHWLQRQTTDSLPLRYYVHHHRRQCLGDDVRQVSLSFPLFSLISFGLCSV